jgi:NAD(P)-dependent dehydrogenase (short-subunit alcohol dehydrogenase family)
MKTFEATDSTTQNVLIFGGTDGLGLRIAHDMAADGHNAIVVGRHDPEVPYADFVPFDLVANQSSLRPEAAPIEERTADLINSMPKINTMVWAPGIFRQGRVDEQSVRDAKEMLDMGDSLYWITRAILDQQFDKVDETQTDQFATAEQLELLTITSTSQYVPRLKEPWYNPVKAGNAHWTKAVALDERTRGSAVIAPSGMKTDFFKKVDAEWPTDSFMEVEDVSERIMMLREFIANKKLNFLEAKILGAYNGADQQLPERIEIVEPVQLADRLAWTFQGGKLLTQPE